MDRQAVANPVSHFFLKIGRRLRRRMEIDAEARATIVSGASGERSAEPIVGRTVNLSQNGALLILPDRDAGPMSLDVASGDQVSNLLEVEICTEPEPQVRFRAMSKVIWIEEMGKDTRRPPYYLVGVRFVKLFQRDAEALGEILGG
jgi:hypothetical protein